MRKRDRLKALLPPGIRSPSPQPWAQIPNRTTSASQSTLASQSTTVENPAFRPALERHIDSLPAAEKQAFLESGAQSSSDNILLSIKELDEQHRSNSRVRSFIRPLSGFVQVLNRFMNGISIVVQANPDVSSLVVGGIRIVLDVAIGFIAIFDKLAEMLCRFGDFLGPLTKYAQNSSNAPLLFEPIARVYGDLLQFCRRTRDIFVGSDGNDRRWPSWKVFLKFQWDFNERFKTIELDLHHHFDLLQHASGASILEEVLRLSQSEKERRDREHNQERESCLNWISSASYEEKHRAIYSNKHPGTGEWLFQHPRYSEWEASTSSALHWCHGKPGAGKSVLASNVVETIKEKFSTHPEIGICFTYCDYKEDRSLDFHEIILALMQKLCRQGHIPESLVKAKQNVLPRSTLATKEHFSELAHSFDEIFLVLDALDECPTEQRRKVLGFLRGVTTDIPRIRIFVTSRRERDILDVFEDLKSPVIEIEALNINEDIKQYVCDAVAKLRLGDNGMKLYLNSDTLAHRIVDTLTNKAEGMFLWVNLQLKNLCEASELRNHCFVEQALDTLPRTLDETYLRIADQIDGYREEKRRLAVACLMWVFYAARPLHIWELQRAVVWSASVSDGLRLDLPSEEVILDACSNLLIRERAIFRPIHYSAQEFFTGSERFQDRRHTLKSLSLASHAHEGLGIACVEYLTQTLPNGPFEKTSSSMLGSEEQDPVLYAAKFVDYHAFSACQFSKQQLQQPFLRRLDEFLSQGSFAAFVQARMFDIYRPVVPIIPQGTDKSTIIYGSHLYGMEFFKRYLKGKGPPNSALIHAASLGSTDVVARLIDNGADVNGKDSGTSETALDRAIQVGDIEMVRLLLDRGADANPSSRITRSRLMEACWICNISMMQLLINHGAKVNRQGRYRFGCLHITSMFGNEEGVRLLLDHGADPSAYDTDNGTALQEAAKYSNKNIVQMIIDAGADIDRIGGPHGNALQAAASTLRTNIDVLELLLRHGADVNARGGKYGSAIQAAAATANVEALQMLLDHGADINLRDGKYGSVLHAAIMDGTEDSWGNPSHKTAEALLKLLNHGADVNAEGGKYGTAVAAAEARGWKDVVQLLLTHGARKPPTEC